MMLAEAANGANIGSLKGFVQPTKTGAILRIAGLLHDCGKITSRFMWWTSQPKLETIFDRIHLGGCQIRVPNAMPK